MIDHLVFAGADLAEASRQITSDVGARPTPGGSHVGKGTRNELLGLGGSTYLEIIGPDVDQPEPEQPRPFGVDRRTKPSLVAWCARPARSLGAVIADARAAGIDFGDVASMSRRRPDDVLLEWELTVPQLDGPLGAALPFLIDWGQSVHPTDSLTAAARLIDLKVTTPQPALIIVALEIIGIDSRCTVRRGPHTALVARLAAPRGEVTLSS